MTQPAATTRLRDPDFIVIGAMKAGTTTLFEQLRRHPQIFMADPKEPNYFSMDEVHARGREWYRGLFATADGADRCGEASPSYTRRPRFPDTARRMAAELPDVKLIYIMRHPVDRFYSNYVFDRAYGFTDTVRETLANRSYVLETSRYIDQIKNYLEFYPRENLLPLLMDDLAADPRSVMAKVARFIGVSDFAPRTDVVGRTNPRGRQLAVRQANRLIQTIRDTPGAQAAARLLPDAARAACRRLITDSFPSSFVGAWVSRRGLRGVEPLTEKTRFELHSRLDESTAELERFLGRDLSHWRYQAEGAPK